MTELTPIRRGRCAGAGNWQTQYQALQMTAREAAELIRDGDTAAFAAMSNWPWELDGALAERLLETGGHIAIYGHFIPAGTRLLTPELAGQVTYDSNFYGVERGLEPMGNVHYAPSNLSQTPAWLLARRPRVAALTCSLPDENGWMSRSLWGTSRRETRRTAASRATSRIWCQTAPASSWDWEGWPILWASVWPMRESGIWASTQRS